VYAGDFSDRFQPRGKRLGAQSAAAQNDSHDFRDSNILLAGPLTSNAVDPSGGGSALRLATTCFEASQFTLPSVPGSRTLRIKVAPRPAYTEMPHGTLQISSMGQIPWRKNWSRICPSAADSLNAFTRSRTSRRRLPFLSALFAAGSKTDDSEASTRAVQCGSRKAISKRSLRAAMQYGAIRQERTGNDANGPERKFGKTVVVKRQSFRDCQILLHLTIRGEARNRKTSMGPCKFGSWLQIAPVEIICFDACAGGPV
jgi:hypothetical protein